jgi:hypothetical protein
MSADAVISLKALSSNQAVPASVNLFEEGSLGVENSRLQ